MEQAGAGAPKEVDIRESFVSLGVSPGFGVVNKHLQDSRDTFDMMADFLAEYAALEQEYARKLSALANSATAKFEKPSVTQRATTWLGIKSAPATSAESLGEWGTTNAAWLSVRDGMTLVANTHHQMGALVQAQVVDSMKDYLNETAARAAKVEGWGVKLSNAMDNYIRKAEEAKQTYHARARTCRLNHKLLEEAEKQSQIGGITRGVLLSNARLAKLREAAEQSRVEELSSAREYRDALEVVAKKKNELYSIRLPRVMQEIQKQTEDRTGRVKSELGKLVSVGEEVFPAVVAAFQSMGEAVSGINPTIDSRVFVAAKTSNDSIPSVMEFEPYDQQSLALVSAGDALADEIVVESDLSSLLLVQEKRDSLIAHLTAQEDPVAVSGVRFFSETEAFRNGVGDNVGEAVAIFHTYLADDSVELLKLPDEAKLPLVTRIAQEDFADKSMFHEAARHVLSDLEANDNVRSWLERQQAEKKAAKEEEEEEKKKPPPPKHSPAPADGLALMEAVLGIPEERGPKKKSSGKKSKKTSKEPTESAPDEESKDARSSPAQLVLLDKPAAEELLEDDLLNSDDELLNRMETIDDVLLGSDSLLEDDDDGEDLITLE